MNAKRDEVVATLVEAGMDADNVKGWSDKEMAAKIKGLPAIKDELKEPKGFPLRKLLKKLLKAAGAGDEIVIESAETNGHAETNGSAKIPVKKSAKNKKAKEPGAPSNKEVVYKLWKKAPTKADPETLHQNVKEAVKLATIRAWVSDWKRKTNLPACAAK